MDPSEHLPITSTSASISTNETNSTSTTSSKSSSKWSLKNIGKTIRTSMTSSTSEEWSRVTPSEDSNYQRHHGSDRSNVPKKNFKIPEYAVSNVRIVHLWKNGFSIDGGPLINYDDDRHVNVITLIERREIPHEWLSQGIGCRVEGHRPSSYLWSEHQVPRRPPPPIPPRYSSLPPPSESEIVINQSTLEDSLESRFQKLRFGQNSKISYPKVEQEPQPDYDMRHVEGKSELIQHQRIDHQHKLQFDNYTDKVKGPQVSKTDHIKLEQSVSNDVDMNDLNEPESELTTSKLSSFTMLNNLTSNDVAVGKDVPTFNILLLGETGVGKSTFINALANYLKYSSMEEAERSDRLECLIPTSFQTMDERFVERTITFGEDSNENTNSDGKSATQKCRSYLFRFQHRSMIVGKDVNLDDGFNVRFIDTPGVGDCRGIEQDNVNLEHILTFIGRYDKLHAVCLLLKPNNSRLNTLFEFCVKQLLSHLEKSAANNIVFVFTNARQTFYKPGDTIGPLRQILDLVKRNPPHVDIPVGFDNVFCLDNESFRWLVSVKHHIRVDDDERRQFETSWSKSVDECRRLITTVTNMTPHIVQDTISINEARRLIATLTKPIVEITSTIEMNMKRLKDQERKLSEHSNDIEKLKDHLFIPIFDIEVIRLNRPRIVCCGPNCRKAYSVGNQTKYHYPQVCLDPCYDPYVREGLVGDYELRFCPNFFHHGFNVGNCKSCRCRYRFHAKITYSTKLIETKIENDDVIDEILTRENAKDRITKLMEHLRNRRKVYQEERDEIASSSAKFANFLKHNAISSYTNSFRDYLIQLIDQEKSLTEFGANNQQVIEGLEQTLHEHDRARAAYDDMIAKSGTTNLEKDEKISKFEVFDTIDRLMKLKMMGKKIAELSAAHNAARNDELSKSHHETVIDVESF